MNKINTNSVSRGVGVYPSILLLCGLQIKTLGAQMQRNEQIFETDLKKYAPFFSCIYIHIPDTKMINKFNRKLHKESKRPFDGILLTKKINLCIECKYGNNSLKPHQKVTQDIINQFNDTFYVLRKKVLKKSVIYTIEKPEKINLMQSEKIEDIFIYFNRM